MVDSLVVLFGTKAHIPTPANKPKLEPKVLKVECLVYISPMLSSIDTSLKHLVVIAPYPIYEMLARMVAQPAMGKKYSGNRGVKQLSP